MAIAVNANAAGRCRALRRAAVGAA